MKKRVLSLLICLLIALNSVYIMPANLEASAVSPTIETALQWAINTANDNSHGYSQSNRWGPDYDCSSFVISALKYAGFDVGSASYTGNLRSNLTGNGFVWIPWSKISSSANLQRGDILLNEATHTEFYLGNNQNVGAHYDHGYPQTGDQTGTEISISGYYYNPWDGVLRYQNSSTSCYCSDSYAGNYVVTTSQYPLTMRSGHGTNYSQITTIPKGATVYVSKADGSWAHVSYNGYNGYCSMQYLKKIDDNRAINLNAWISNTNMGKVSNDISVGKDIYLCYELTYADNGSRIGNNFNYSVYEEVYNPDGSLLFSYTYNNSDKNCIKFNPEITGIYKYKVIAKSDKFNCIFENKINVNEHSHNFGPWTTTKAATCTTAGTQQRKCSICGNTESRTIEAKNHSYKAVTVKPTYFAKGYTYKKCSVCGKTTKKTELPLLTMAIPRATAAANSIKLSWNKVAGAQGYEVWQLKSGKWTKIKTTTSTSYTISKLPSGTSQKFAIKPYTKKDGKIVYGCFSKQLYTTTNPATINFNLTAGSKKATVKWNKVTGASGYKVYYKTASSGWKLLKTVNNSTTSFTKTGLTKGKTYYFTVKAYRTINGKTYNGGFVTKSVKIK
ncbi:MAG: fibronectin type III domain-containing protein [Oscillospiraceae bacterium]